MGPIRYNKADCLLVLTQEPMNDCICDEQK